MKITWLGHSAFLIESDSGVRIITDPYDVDAYSGAIKYGAINEYAEVVTISHDHPDHGCAKAVKGNPMVIKGAGKFVVRDIEFLGIQTMHDESGGSERGKNVVFIFTVDGVKICHLGDLGHIPTSEQLSQIGSIDVLLVPVGGYFTIGAEEAWEVAEKLNARVVIPMHYKTEKIGFPIAPVDEFLRGKPNVKRLDSASVELSADSLPTEREILVLKHAK